MRDARKDLFGVDVNNPTDKFSLLYSQLTNFDFHQSVKKIGTNKWKKIN